MSLELYIGPMFAGKSSTILGIIRKNNVIGRKTLCVTSALDKRYTEEAKIVSHNQESHPATAVSELLPLLYNPEFQAAECIIIEEAQFFADLKEFVLKAVDELNKNVVCVGLDGDSERRFFGQLLYLVPYADKVQKLTAMCMKCRNGTEAIFTHRKVGGGPGSQISVGGQDKYEPMCRKHYLLEKMEEDIYTFIQENMEEGHSAVLEKAVQRFGKGRADEIYQKLRERGMNGPSLR